MVAPGTPMTPTRYSDALLKHAATMSDFSSSRKVSRARSLEDAHLLVEGSAEKARGAGSLGGALKDLGDPGRGERVSPVHMTMRHACRGLVRRISLEPKVITDLDSLTSNAG